jgi:arabinofuranosyltransferase
MSDMQNSRTVLGFLLVVLAFLLHTWLYADFFIDDAFISLRYIRQWLAGNGLVYNIGDPVEGYSSFLWIILLGLTGRFGMDLIVAARVWGIGFSLATLLLAYVFARRLPFPLFTPLFLGLSAPFAMWAVGGLENPLFMLLALAGSILFYREEERDSGWSSSICWGLLALTRPEGLLFGAIASLYRFTRLYRLRKRPGAQDYQRMAVLAVIVLPHLIWRLAYYGYPVPNTYYAKSMGFHLRTLLEGGHYIFRSLEVVGGFFFCGLLVLLVLRARHSHRYAGYFTMNVAGYLLFIFLAGGDWMPAQRFLANILPLLVIVLHVGAVELTRLLAPIRRELLVQGLVFGQILYIAAIALNLRFIEPGIPVDHRLSRPYPWIAYLQERIHEDSVVAIFDAGRAGYELPLTARLIDMVGLTDMHIARRPPEFPGGTFGRGDAWGRWDAEYILSQNPGFVQIPVSGRDDQGRWQTGFTGTTVLANHPRFRERYRQTEMPVIFERADPGVTVARE